MSTAENEQWRLMFDEGDPADEELSPLEIAQRLAYQALESEHQAAELRVRAAQIL
ncbi:hypothetical protein [Nonomuraea jiangxiensis]|uniref:Uncharacterized protein n=1 Tax=Nonomuraea jiangxiensis TaxID=633440 RepID=A0A1G9WH06_9ACTN|nr:hypothetical protein [Nonomuraea jiangxiensis]SDM83456.1 hypothetical protein SAMN05421869_1593 [Nonomuraea jiangxiensis]